MRLIKFFIFMLFLAAVHPVVYAQGGLLRGAKTVLSPQAAAVARQSFKQAWLLNNVSRSLVQVSRPGASEVLGTGFIFRAHKRLWVAMPYHIGGVAGSRRIIRFAGENNLPQEREITIAVNGNAGWHAPDVSLALLPEQDFSAVRPLEIGWPNLNETAYSFGYVSGRVAGLDEILPVERHIFSAEGFGLISDRVIAGENLAAPFNISGYCGSPVLQYFQGEWRAVGLHTGSCLAPDGRSRSYAVHLPRVLPLLLRRYLGKDPGYSRSLLFRGWNLGKLLPSERVHSIEVWRGGERVFSRLLRNFPDPYSDAHSELALVGIELLPQDILRYEIRNNQREVRYLSYTLP